MSPEELKAFAELHGAFETDPWAADAILRVELMTEVVVDPCCGTGILTAAAEKNGHHVHAWDIVDWSKVLPCRSPDLIIDFLAPETLEEWAPFGCDFTIFMNPPFSLACEFVDRAKALGARKIISFQRWPWRESGGRREWWQNNPPARTWICGERATCWRFDVPKVCVGLPDCGKGKGRGVDAVKCRECMAGTPTSHGFFVWEKGHKGAESIGDLWKNNHPANWPVSPGGGNNRE